MIPALATVNEILYRRTLFEGPSAGNSHQRFCGGLADLVTLRPTRSPILAVAPNE